MEPSTIGAEKSSRDPLIPKFSPGPKASELLWLPLAKVKQTGISRVVIGTDHTSYIFERRLLGTTFGQGPHRFALKINNNVIVTDAQHLAQVIIAMTTNLKGTRGELRKHPKRNVPNASTIPLALHFFQQLPGRRRHLARQAIQIIA